MRRSALLLAVGLFVAAAPAAGPPADGNWLLTTSSTASEQAVCILKIETKDGKTTAEVLATPPAPAVRLGAKAAGAKVVRPAPARLTVKEVRADGAEVAVTFSTGTTFAGTVKGGKEAILGGYGTGQSLRRAKLAPTEKGELTAQTARIAVKAPEPMTKAQRLESARLLAGLTASREKDAEKKKELRARADEARKEADEKVPGLYREVVAKHRDDPAAVDAGLALLRSAAKWNVTRDEAADLVKLVKHGARPYGVRYAKQVTTQIAETLIDQKGLEPVALAMAKEVTDGLTDADPATVQVQVLTTYRTALTNSGREAEAKSIAERLAELDAKLDAEYLATVPPFKPTGYAGRKESGANRVAVLELFTGAQCPPCIAADVAFDALAQAYKPTDLVLIQYHMHIPGPDPLTNRDSIARWDYYKELFPEGIRGTPSTVFNGKPQAGGGGAMTNAESKFSQYRKVIDPLLEETTPVKVSGRATRTGDRLAIAVQVDGASADDDLRVRLVAVEGTVKYVGGNRLRFHHNVVRDMPGGADGVKVAAGTFRHAATTDVGELRTELTKYLDDYAAEERPFPKPDRPLEMKELKVIALVQSDKTGAIVQAVQLESAPAR